MQTQFKYVILLAASHSSPGIRGWKYERLFKFNLMDKLTSLKWSSCSLAILLTTLCLAQPSSREKMSFDHLGVIEGLSQSWVLAIAQDMDGFMWIGTRDGLNRYDGRNFKIYRTSRSDSASLYSSHITSLLIDSRDRMWVGTVTGLNHYRREKDQFERIPVREYEEIHINDLAEGENSIVWIAAVEGLFRYDPEQPNPEIELIFQSEEISKTSSGRLKSVFQDSNGILWVDAEGGLIRLDFNDKNDRVIQSQVKLPKDDIGAVRDIVEYPKGTLWMGTDRGGVFSFNLASEEFDHLPEEAGLSNFIKKIVPDTEKKELWIGTRHGLSIYELTTGSIRNIRQNIHDPNSLSANSIHSIYKDKDGSYWLGTYSSGINIYSDSFFKITTYQVKPGNQGLNNPTVSGINEMRAGEYLIGTEGGGLNYYNAKTGEYRHYVHDPDRIESLPLNYVKCIFKEKDGTFWIGTSGGGVCNFDPKTGIFRRFTYTEIGIGQDAWVYSVDQDKNGILWFGIFENGLRWYDKKTGKNGLISSATDNSFFFSGIRKLLVDSRNRIWVGTENGLSVYDQDQKSFRYFMENPENPLTLRSNVVYTLYEDSNQTIWIGTLGGGLNRYEEASDSFRFYQVRDGMPGDNVFGILEDSSGYLWLSTNSGISKFDPVHETFQNYTIQDGFLDMEYGYNAYFKSESGELFFGGRNGLVSFYPEAINENKSIPPVVLTDVKLFNKTVRAGDESGILQDQIGLTSEIVLNHNQDVFTLNFAVLNYVKPAKNQFAYRLIGLEEDWNFVGAPSATYMNLPPGIYTFQAKGGNNDGYWNPDPVELKIVVKPAPWKTIWAYAGYLILLLSAIFAFIRYERIKVALQHDLRLQEFENDRQKNQNQAKLNFFTDISHEIRTPLTLMLGPIEEIAREYQSERKLYKHLITIKNNADRLLRLVNQLLDFRKRESEMSHLKAAEGNLIKFIKEISLVFKDQARKRNISYHFQTDVEDLRVYYDRDEMEKVFFNLISNAFKYTPDSQTIEIVVSAQEKFVFEGSRDPEEAVKIEIRDSGIGINAQDMEKIFERYYEGDHAGINSLSTGIGLSLSKSIIKAHKGAITCQSSKGSAGRKNSTVFTVYLRYGRKHLNSEDVIENFQDSEQIEKYHELLIAHDTKADKGNVLAIPDASKSQTVLIVEDNDEIREFLADRLTQYYHVAEAANGKEGFEMAVEIIPDLVISDVIMPELDGVELCHKLKTDERTSHTPIILLTARTSLIHKVEGLDSGADDYITKPFSLELLKVKVRNLIESRDLLRRKFGREITLQPENIVISDPDEKFLRRAMSILDEHISDPDFKVNHFIKEIGMSRTVLYRKIKAVTNLSIIDFINNYRLNHAISLMKANGDMNISELAFRVGFSDPKYFSRIFRQKFGDTPKKYISAIHSENGKAEVES